MPNLPKVQEHNTLTQAVFTQKGQAWIAQKLISEGLTA